MHKPTLRDYQLYDVDAEAKLRVDLWDLDHQPPPIPFIVSPEIERRIDVACGILAILLIGMLAVQMLR